MLMDHKIIITLLTLHYIFHKRNGIIILPADISLEMELPNGIKIYGNKQAVKQITNLVNDYSSI